MHLHILGICGTLMGSIALLAKAQGHTVSGTDENVYPPMSDQLEAAGIVLSTPYTTHCIPPETELVMIGNANLPRGNAAVEAVLDRGLPYVSGAEYLGRYLLQDKWVVAISGTHGKTSTTSMVAWILEYAGMKPGFLVGGVPVNFGRSAQLGESDFFVIEADEYDTSYFDRRSKFLHYRPRTLVMNNLEYDHADIFPDLEAIKNQFHLLLRTVPRSGQVIYPEADLNLADVLDRGCWSTRMSLGPDGALQAKPLANQHAHFDVLLNGRSVGQINWSQYGEHNQNNALAAIAAARHVGITPEVSCEALNLFKGVKRRLEVIHDSPTLTLYDDFAHHPTAIRLTLEGLRQQAGEDKILALIEPGSHTMRKGTHAETLLASTRAADDVLWFEPANLGWDIRQHLNLDDQHLFADIDALAEAALAACQSGQFRHVVVMSNSGFGGLHRKLVNQLEKPGV